MTPGYGSISLAVPELMARRRSAADTFSVPVAERRNGSNSRQPSSRAIVLAAASPVVDDYPAPFPFTGDINSVTFTLHPTADGNDIAAIVGSEPAKE